MYFTLEEITGFEVREIILGFSQSNFHETTLKHINFFLIKFGNLTQIVGFGEAGTPLILKVPEYQFGYYRILPSRIVAVWAYTITVEVQFADNPIK